jgi:CRISPR-associated protein Csb1
MFEELKGKRRLLMEATMVPMQGERFQPTGFPDLGAGTYQLADGTRMLLVESSQSMANRLENTILDTNNELLEDLEGLSYIRVHLTGATDTSTTSLSEAHRINSPFIITDEKFQERFGNAAGYAKGKPIDWKKVAKALFRYDINSLLHGVFLANLGDGRIKMPRTLSGFIEARGAREVVSGGVKFNHMDPSGKIRAKDYDKDVYGNVPYQRVEYTAENITAFFNMDLGLLESYGFDEEAYDLLIALGLYKVIVFLERGTRLRTACDFKLKDSLTVAQPSDFEVPNKTALLKYLKKRIVACRSLFANPPVTEINRETELKKKKEETK